MRFRIVLFLSLFSYVSLDAQDVEFKEYEVEYVLPPLVGTPLTASQGLTAFQYRGFAKGSKVLPEENRPNTLGEEQLFFYVKDWKQVRKEPQFYLDIYYGAPKILEEKVVERNKTYAVQAPYTEKAYEIRYRMPATAKLVKADGTVMMEFASPDEDMFYHFTESLAGKLGYKTITGNGFQNEVALLEATKMFRDKMLEDLELSGAKKLTISGARGRNNLPDYIHYKLFPFEGRDKFALGLFTKTQGTAFAHLKLEEANKAATAYYDAVKADYSNWLTKKDLIISALKIWADALSQANSLEKLPEYKELKDAFAYNLSVGSTFLNAFETAEVAIQVLNTDETYGIGIGKINRQSKMETRGKYHLNSFIPYKRELAKIRGFEKVQF